MDFWDIVDLIGRALTIVTAVGAVFGTIFHQAVGEWIKSRFARTLSRESEELKHQFSRELEAHKAALLRDMETFKLDLDLRRSVLLQIASSKVSALQKIMSDVSTATKNVLVIPQNKAEAREPLLALARTSMDTANASWSENQIFLPQELSIRITTLLSKYAGFLADFSGDAAPIPSDSPQIRAAIVEAASVLADIKIELQRAGEIATRPGVPPPA